MNPCKEKYRKYSESSRASASGFPSANSIVLVHGYHPRKVTLQTLSTPTPLALDLKIHTGFDMRLRFQKKTKGAQNKLRVPQNHKTLYNKCNAINTGNTANP